MTLQPLRPSHLTTVSNIVELPSEILVMLFRLVEENLRALLRTCKTFNRAANIVSGRTKFAGMMSRHLIIKIDKYWNEQMFRHNELILVKNAYYSANRKTTVVCLNLNMGSHSSVELDGNGSISYEDRMGYFSTYFGKGDVSFIDFNNQGVTPTNVGEDSCSHTEKGLQLQLIGNQLHLVERGQIIQTWNSHPSLRRLQYAHFWIIDENRIILKCSDYNVLEFHKNSSVPVLKLELRKYFRMFDTPEGYLALISPPYTKDEKREPWIIHLLSKENFKVVQTFTSEAFRVNEPPLDRDYFLSLDKGKIYLNNLTQKTTHEITTTKGNYFKLSFPFAAIVNPGFTHDHLEIWNVSARVKISTQSFFGNIHHVSLSNDYLLVQTDTKVHIFTLANLKVSDKVDAYYVQGFWQSLLNLINRIIAFVKNWISHLTRSP